MKTGVLHAGITEVVEELDAVDSQHGGQRVGMASPSGRRVAEPAPAKAGGRMRSSGFCRGIRESIRSRACPRENGGTVPGGSCASCPGIPNPQTACPRENGGRLVHLPLPPTSIPYRTSASPALLCHITTDLFRGFLDSKVVTNCAVRSEGGTVNDDLLGVHARLGIGASSPSEKDDR